MPDSGRPTAPPVPSPYGAVERRDELDAAPPFLSWRAIYAIVLGALAVEVVLLALWTAANQ